MTPLPFALLFFLQCLAGLACAVPLALAFGHDWSAPLLHLPVLLAWWSLFAMLAAGLSLRRPALAALGAVFQALPLVVYLSQAISHRAWGGPMHWSILLRFGPAAGTLSRQQGLDPLPWAAALLALLAMLYALWWILAPSLQRGLAWVNATTWRRRSLLGLGLGLLAACALAVAAPRQGLGGNALMADPLLSLWAPAVFPLTPARLELARQDQALRKAYAARAQGSRNVIVIICDALRADHMSLYGYPRPTTPFLQELARSGKLWWPQRALAGAPATAEGLVGLLASRDPSRLGPGLFKLNELLYDQGWRTHLMLSGDQTWMGLGEALGAHDTLQDGTLGPFAATSDDALLPAWLEALPPDGTRPAYLQFHLMSAHSTGYRDPAFVRWQPAEMNGLRWHDVLSGNYDPERMRNRYDNGVLQADAMLSRLFAMLKARGFLDDAVVLVTADHGEALGERGRWGHGLNLDKEALDVPLLVWDSRGACCPSHLLATHADAAPTLLAALGLPAPASWQGRPLQAPPQTERWHYTATATPEPEHAVFWLVNAKLWKLRVRGRGADSAHGESLVELLGDPDEKEELVGKVDPALLDRMRQVLWARAAGKNG